MGEYLFYLLYHLGKLELVIFTRTVMALIAFWLVGYEAKRRSGSWRIAALVTTPACIITINNLVVRPQNWSWLPFMVFFILLSRFADRQLRGRWLLAPAADHDVLGKCPRGIHPGTGISRHLLCRRSHTDMGEAPRSLAYTQCGLDRRDRPSYRTGNGGQSPLHENLWLCAGFDDRQAQPGINRRVAVAHPERDRQHSLFYPHLDRHAGAYLFTLSPNADRACS